MKMVFDVDGKKVPLRSLQYISKANQLDVMRKWFYENYEDPANACPYESREGGYFYIYGGPYEADEELQAMFEGYVKDDYIQELANELQDQCLEWSGNSNNIADWYDDDLYDAVTSSENPYLKFVDNIEKIQSMAKDKFKKEHKEHLLKILYTNVITALETLYVELFIKSIGSNKSYISEFIEKGKTEFRINKALLASLFKGEDITKIRAEIVKAIKEHLVSASWHNTKKVVERYEATFGFEAKEDWPIDKIELATQKRNHLVHRGGKDKDGKLVVITDEDLKTLMVDAMLIGKNLSDSVTTALLGENGNDF